MVLILLGVPATASAHGGGEPRLTDAAAGPYRIFVWTQPTPWRAGEVHVSVAVTQPAPAAAAGAERLDAPITDAEVTIRFEPYTQPDRAFSVAAEPSGTLSGTTYEADAELPFAGAWRVVVHVKSPLGEGAAHFDAEALPARAVDVRLIVVGALLLIVLAAVVVWMRRVRVAPAPVLRQNRRA